MERGFPIPLLKYQARFAFLYLLLYAPIILLNSSNKIFFTPSALNTKPTAMSAMIKNPISFENSLLNARYSPVITIATNTNDWALVKNQLYRFCPKFIISFLSLLYLFRGCYQCLIFVFSLSLLNYHILYL